MSRTIARNGVQSRQSDGEDGEHHSRLHLLSIVLPLRIPVLTVAYHRHLPRL